jgi:hypothetical protein
MKKSCSPFFKETNANHCVELSLMPLFMKLTEDEMEGNPYSLQELNDSI